MGSSPNDPKSTGATAPPPDQPINPRIDFYEILHHVSEALAVVKTDMTVAKLRGDGA